MRITIAALLICCTAFSAEPAPAPVVANKTETACDPAATAEWLCSVFDVRDGKILVAGKAPEKYLEARLPFKRPTEIKFYGHTRIIADQEGMYPMIIGPTEHAYIISIYTPFYAFLDRGLDPDGLPGYTPHPKDSAMTRKGFRIICEKIHAHFCKAVERLPECHRVSDALTYPAEYYIWSIGDSFIILTAYNGNDSDGIHMNITTELSEVEKIRKMHPTTEKIFDDWGESMAHLPNPPKN